MSAGIEKKFHPLASSWFAARFGAPTQVQSRAWAEISEGGNVLVTAPTGSGKTLAAFLWAIDRLITGAWSRGATRILYISPLKALNNDVRKNLVEPLHELRDWFGKAGESFPAITVQTRSGDTPGSERQRMLRHPPEILITTPESLNILLTSRSGRHMLGDIATVILDEIHAVAGTKRGTHLITAVDRLVPLCGEFQRIALSATVRPLELVADFVGGMIRRGEKLEKRPVSVIRADQAKDLRVEVRAPETVPGETEEDFWPRLAAEFKKIIAEHRSTLFFANSRRTTERVTRLINEGEPTELAYAHHGSLSKEIRLAVEEKLKRGELKAIVATNSLELGIDIGLLDTVVLIQSPVSVSSAIQRIGRSGHGVGETSRGMLFPSHGMDFVEAAVIARAIAERDLEPVRPVEAPLDLLVQIILSMTLAEEWNLDDLYAFLRTSWPYRNLPRRQFDLVVGMLEGRYADSRIPELRPRVTVDRLVNSVVARQGVAPIIYREGGTIPDRGYFDLRLKETGGKIGELDEEFVWERRVGETFALGAQVWQIREITHNAVEVTPARRAVQVIPFWRAEELDRQFHYAEKIALFLERANEHLHDPDSASGINVEHALDDRAAEALSSFLVRQKEATGTDLPHRHHLLAEHFHDPRHGGGSVQVILHTLWGNGLNRPFTFALAAAWEKRFGLPLEAFYTNEAVAILLPREVSNGELFSLVTPENIEMLLRSHLESTGYFGARFRENAGRALLLPKAGFRKRMPLWLTRLRSKKLMAAVSRYPDFPILLETWRSCMQDDFDLPNLKRLLGEIHEGEVRLGETHTTVASPFAEGIIWQQTNAFMYQDDTPADRGGTALGRELIREVALSPHLRPRIPVELIRLFEAKRQRTAPGYAPEGGRELVDWVKERLLIPRKEWDVLLQSIARDHGIDPADVVTATAERLVHVRLWKGESVTAAIEMLPEVTRAFGVRREDVSVEPLVDDEVISREVARLVEFAFGNAAWTGDAEEGEWSAERVLGQWLSFYGPLEAGKVERIGVTGRFLREAITVLEGAEQIVVGQFSETVVAPEVCDAANLEALLRMLRRSRQPALEPLPLERLPLFLATFQGIVEPGKFLDDLRARLEQLFGLPLPAAAWEEEVLPARLTPYNGAWLDSLMQTSPLTWFGCGEKRLAFAFPEDLPLLRDPVPADPEEREVEARLIPDPRGRYGFSAIWSGSGRPASDVAADIWRLAWMGRLTNDSFVAVRKGIAGRFGEAVDEPRGLRRPSSRWKTGERTSGNWYLLPIEVAADDPLELEEMNKDRVRILLGRYGILFRELLQRELPPLQWPRLFRTLRIMELSGEVIAGSFFSGIPGLQFASPEAYRMLTRPLPEQSIYWMNAADPASLCGSGLEGFRDCLPPRVPGTHLVFHGSRLVVVSRRYGKELDIHVPPDDPHLRDYLGFFHTLLTREFNPRRVITVERINEREPAGSVYRKAFLDAGYQESYKGLELWKKY